MLNIQRCSSHRLSVVRFPVPNGSIALHIEDFAFNRGDAYAEDARDEQGPHDPECGGRRRSVADRQKKVGAGVVKQEKEKLKVVKKRKLLSKNQLILRKNTWLSFLKMAKKLKLLILEQLV